MSRIRIGQRIRDRRRALGLPQRALADQLGISTSYLSLIENDRRMIAGRLLNQAAEALDLDLEYLSASRDARLADELAELANSMGRPTLAEGPASDLASRHPQWSRLLIEHYRALIDTRDMALALSDRLNRDPALVELSHQTLTEITSVRSAAEILAQYPGLAPQERQRFINIIVEASDRLSASARSMINLLEGPDAPLQAHSPARDVEDFIIDRNNYFGEIEEALQPIAQSLPDHGLGLSAVIAARLEADHGVTITRGDGPDRDCASQRSLHLPTGLSEPTIRFLLARHLIALELSAVIDAVVGTGRFETVETKQRMGAALARYGAGALLMPYDRFAEAAESHRHDLVRLQGLFHASHEQIAHRLVTLRKPGSEGIPFAFVRADPAGNISKRFSLPGLYMPQFGGACPLWALYAAFSAGGRQVTQLAEMSDGQRFIFMARQVRKGAPSSKAADVRYAVMLSCEARYASRIVHADPLGSGKTAAATPVGWECRSCPRTACDQRAHSQLEGEHSGQESPPQALRQA
ncbi:MAG: short-chain fatty acyl-CoA regulator family protein [Pseudomonadota bacterium]